MTDDSRASRVLAEVLRRVPPPDEENGNLRVLGAWVDGDAICVVYQGWWHDGVLGLRRTIEAEASIEQIAGYIVDAELGEPPGLLVENVSPDPDGITWWHGDKPEWRDYHQRG